MIYNVIALEFSVLIAAHDGNTTLLFVDTSINRSIDNPAQCLESMQHVKGGMRVIRKIGFQGISNDHAGTPGVTSEKKIKRGLFQFLIGVVAGELPVPVALYRKGCL